MYLFIMEFRVFNFRPLQFWNQFIQIFKFNEILICNTLSLLFDRYMYSTVYQLPVLNRS